MAIIEQNHPLDNKPNSPVPPQGFTDYRSVSDELVASLHDGHHIMPRTGIFDEEDYSNVVSDPATVFDENGLPLIAAYTVAYPNANLDKYPELVDRGYLMLPLEALKPEQLELIKSSTFSEFIGEVTFNNFIDYSKGWEASKEKLANIQKDIQERINGTVQGLESYSSAEPFDGDGRPMIHHQFTIKEWSQAPHEYNPDVIDTITAREQIVAKAPDLAHHHIDAFSTHSKSATLITLDHADEIEAMFSNPAWFIAAHINDEKEIDCALVVTNSIGETPWLDPASISDEGLLVNVDSISTAESARRKGVALHVLIDAINRQFELAEDQGKDSLVIPFDTAGDSTESVPALAHAVFEATGAKVVGGRVDVLAHVLLKK